MTVCAKQLALAITCSVLSLAAHAQAKYTAGRAGDLQIGGGYTSANAGYQYVNNRIGGVAFYSDFDFREHCGVRVSFHQLNDPNSAVYQRTFEAGGRYVRHYGPVSVYGSGMAGRGILNFPKNDANLGYNILAGGIGADYAIRRRINLRAEFEYQDWLGAPGSGLTINPSLITIGVAYHFDAGVPHR